MNSKNHIKYRAYQFSLDIIMYLKNLPSDKLLWSITNQLLRSSTSIGANIIEGYAASSKKDFINYYAIALKSSNETIYWLSLFKDGYNLDVNKYISEVKEISKILAASIKTMRNNK